MASKNRLTQSPRALRDSTQDPLEHSKGEVQLGMNEPSKSGSPENAGAWKIHSEREASRESGWPPGKV
jgi:hypothetical protein